MKQSPFRKILIITAAVLTVILAASCPQEVTAPMVAMVEDSLVPTITITSPSGGDNYYSTVTVSGILSDDVQVEGDAGGQISSLSYDIANDDFRKGKIEIGLDDQITADTEYGSGTIDYDIITGEFSFTFSTTDPNTLRDLLSLSISTVDRNNNTTVYELNLNESEGPYIDFAFYNSATYTDANEISNLAGDDVYIAGYIGDSEYQKDTADEILSIEWGVVGTSFGGILDLTGDSADWLDNDGIYRSLNYDESDYFFFDPDTLQFSTHTNISLDSGMYFFVEAVDAYGHIMEEQKLLSPPASLQLSTPSADVPYYSPTHAATIQLSAKITDPNDLVLNDYDVSSVYYSFISTDAGDTLPDPVTAYDSGTDDFNTFFTSGNFTLDVDTGLLTGLAGDIGVKIYVTDADDSALNPKTVLLERDTVNPTVSITSFTGGTSGYVKRGDVLTLSFTATDALSGVSDIDSVTIYGTAIASGDITKSGNNYTATFTMPNDATSDADGEDVGYSISLTDNVGNPASASAAAAKTFYGPYSNNICTAESLSYTSSNGVNSDWIRATSTAHDTATLSFTSSRTLSSAPVVTIAGRPATVSSAAAPIYTATFTTGTETLTDGAAVPFTVSLTDIVGNAGSFSDADGATYKTGFTDIYYDNIRPTAPLAPTKDGSQFLNASDEIGTVTIKANYSSGAGGAGDSVKLFLGNTAGTAIGSTAYNTGATTVNVTFSGGLLGSDGTQTFLSTIVDVAGNSSDDSPSLGLTLDTELPTIVAIADQGAWADTLTVTPTCDGTGTAIASYSWVVTGEGTGTVTTSTFTAGSGQALNLALDGSDDGTYNVDFTVTDEAGNPSAVEEFSFIWDAKQFEIDSITGLSANSYHDGVIGDVTANLSGDDSGTSYILWSTDNTDFNFSPSNALITDITSTDDGSANITVTIRDALSRERTASVTNVTWDTLPPTINSITDDQGDKAAPFTITPVCSDTSGIGTYTWTVTKDGSPFAVTNQGESVFAVNEGVNTLTLATDGTRDGDYAVSLMVTDNAGNPAAAAETFYFTWDAKKVEVDSITGLTANSFHKSDILNVVANVSGAECGIAGWEWSSTNTDFTFSAENAQTTDITSSANGSTSITITVTDNLARENTLTLTNVVWDELDPTISNIPDRGWENGNFTVNSSGYVDGTGSAIASYSWVVTGPVNDTLTTTNFASADLSLDTSGSGTNDGSYTVALTVTDQAENSNATAEEFTFDWDTAPPEIDSISNEGNKMAAFTVTTSVTDPDNPDASAGSGVDSSSYNWSVTKDGSAFTVDNQGTTDFEVNEGGSTLSLATNGSEDGDYVATLTVDDNATNTSASESFSFTWDANQFSASITGGAIGYYNSSFALSADITGAESGIDTYAWTSSGTPKLNFSSTDTATTNITVDAGNDDTYTVELEVTDNLGRDNSASPASISFVWDTTAPTAASFPSGTVSNTGNPYTLDPGISDTVSAIGDITFAWTVDGQAFTSSSPTLTIDYGDLLETDTYTVRLSATDQANNEFTGSFTLDWDTSRSLLLYNLSQNTSSGGSSSSTSISSAASINTYNFDTLQSETSSPSESGATQYNTVSYAQASESPSARYSGDLYRPAVLTTRGIAETATTTQETSAQTELDKTSAASLEETKINNETEWDENYINTDGSPKVSLDTSYQSVERRTAVSGNINKLSSKASAAVTGRQTVKPPPVEINEETKKSSALPAAIILLLGGSAAGIIIRKRRI